MLIIFGGLPGVGKTTLAQAVAKHLRATYLRIDSIEQAIKDSLLQPLEVIDAGYMVGYAVARDNLRARQTVVADSVNPLQITRKAWLAAAKDANCTSIQVEVVCSDKTEHEARVKTRKADIAGLSLPSWEAVTTREYDLWQASRIIIDTAGKTVDAAVEELLGQLV
jgi:predicted kinase